MIKKKLKKEINTMESIMFLLLLATNKFPEAHVK